MWLTYIGVVLLYEKYPKMWSMRFYTRHLPGALLAEVAWAEIFSNDAAWAIFKDELF